MQSVDNTNRLSSRWNNDELQLAAKGVRKYGKDFQAIAEMLGSKTESQVRTFYLNYRRKYNLDAMVEEFEQNSRAQQPDDIDESDLGTNDVEVNAGGSEDAIDAAADSEPTINEIVIVTKQSDDDIIMEVSQN